MKNSQVLESHIGYWLRFVSNHTSQSFSKRLAEWDVGCGEWVVLNLLHEHKTLAPAEIAQTVGMTRGATSKLLDRLFNKGLISRMASLKDRRYQEISISAGGEALLPKLIKEAEINEENSFGHLSDEQRNQLLNLLKEIALIKKLNEIPID